MATPMEAVTNTVEEAITYAEGLFPSASSLPQPLVAAAASIGHAVGDKVSIPHVDLTDGLFWQAVLVIVLQPLIWNVIGRFEHHTRILSRVLLRPQIGVYALTVWIFAAGRLRDSIIVQAMEQQERVEPLGALQFRITGGVCVAVGLFLVLTSFLRLGVNGTFLGDYFGILMDEPVTKFPFNVLDDPMYDGSTLVFLGKAILARSPTGLVLTVWVYTMYRIAGIIEGAFLREVYAKRDKEKSS